MDKLRIAVIGVGRISVMHLGAIKYLKDIAELVAVCDIKTDRAKETAGKYGCRAYTDYIEMLDKEKPDAVHICTPHYLHTPMARACFEKGIAVLTEKPMGIGYEDCLKTVEMAERKNILYGVIFQCRYNDSSVLVKKAVASGKLGKIESVVSTLTWSRPDSYYSESDWKGTWDKEGGGVFIDQVIHSLDLANWIIDDEIVSIGASIANRGHKTVTVEDTAEGMIEYKNGVKYGFYCMNNYGCDEPVAIKFFAEKGKAFLTYDYAYIEYNNGSTERAETTAPDVVYGGGKDYWGFMHVRQIEQFYKALQGKERLEISAREALKTQKIINSIYESAKSGEKIIFGGGDNK
ncbi:MAG: Gfo/Idh/MocA family oxidoreductase [Clostridia bacterium]|nr:Gfo/Idh/MocA family oxidoreductase [Clostridia bacterium]